MKKSGTNTAQAVLFLTLVGLVSQIISVFYRMAMAQSIGAERVGLFQLLMPVYSVLLSLCSVGLSSAMAYLSAYYVALATPITG